MEDVITNKVNELHEYLPKSRNGAPKIPINLSKILEKYSLKAYDVNFERNDVSGAFDRKEREIYVNSTDPVTIKNFTLAHELGHYFLHQDVNRDILYREKDRHHREDIEKEANCFAAKLLMPEESIKEYWGITYNIQQLANIFHVSYVAMNNRLHSLGLI